MLDARHGIGINKSVRSALLIGSLATVSAFQSILYAKLTTSLVPVPLASKDILSQTASALSLKPGLFLMLAASNGFGTTTPV
jgi:hypothetical protein